LLFAFLRSPIYFLRATACDALAGNVIAISQIDIDLLLAVNKNFSGFLKGKKVSTLMTLNDLESLK